jgi:hypothetical protein
MGYDLMGCNAKNEKGESFRNNIWWWRQLWTYTCIHCSKTLNEKDIDAGCWNDGKKIVNPKADKIAKNLQETIDDGTALTYEKEIKNLMKLAKAHNKKLSKKLTFEQRFKETDHNENYPFSVKNLKEFIEFCKNSGGFNIY